MKSKFRNHAILNNLVERALRICETKGLDYKLEPIYHPVNGIGFVFRGPAQAEVLYLNESQSNVDVRMFDEFCKKLIAIEEQIKTVERLVETKKFLIERLQTSLSNEEISLIQIDGTPLSNLDPDYIPSNWESSDCY